MHIRKMVIENVRAIERLPLDFVGDALVPRRRVILVGPNGVGKTTVLKAIANVFRHGVGGPSKALFGAGDVRRGSAVTETDKDPPTVVAAMSVECQFTDAERASVRDFHPEMPGVGTLRFDIANTGIWSQAGKPAAMLASSKTSFVLDAEVVKVPTQPENLWDAVVYALQQYHRAPCVLLLADRGTLRDDERVTVGDLYDGPTRRHTALDLAPERFTSVAARLALAHAAPSTYDRDRLVVRLWKVTEKYFPELPRPETVYGLQLVFRTRDGALVTLDEMSDGERAVLLILSEVSRAAPEAIVLVDEIEQHLHPRWQRAIIEALPAMLPGGQFFFTTQAPYVAASAPDDCIKFGGWGDDGT